MSDRSLFGDPDAALEAFQQIPVAAVLVEGSELRIVAHNVMLESWFGPRPLLGLSVREAMPELEGQSWFEHCEDVVRTGRMITGEGFRVHIAQSDGSFLETFLDFTIAPWRRADGSVRGAIAFAQDASERVRARESLDAELVCLRRQYEQARAATLAMQRALLPDSVPVLPALELASRYVLADDEQAAGGDWFDVVAGDGGRVVLVVGDVVGHGTSAAASMGQLRAVLLAALRHGASLTSALELLDEFAKSVPGARSATVCVVEVDTATGELAYCTAGHPPPLILTEDATGGGFVAPSGAGPLGTGSTFEPARGRLDAGSMVVLYSDGLIERDGSTIGERSEELRRIAGDARANLLMPATAAVTAVDRVCELSIELMSRASGVADDITMLAACRTEPPTRFSVEVPADDGLLIAAALCDLRAWIAQLGASTDAVEAMSHAATELVDNVVDHAYLDGVAQTCTIAAELEASGACAVTVADKGTWRDPVATPGRGLGLALVRMLTDELLITHGQGGTTLTVRKALTRPAGLLDIMVERRVVDRQPFDVWSADDAERRLTVRGPVDGRAVAELDAQIGLMLPSTARPLIVDLSDVTVLASAGVHLLRRAITSVASAGGQLVLYAAPDTPAQQVLALTATPHVTDRA
jgi:PAS domain S-box-containing protein